MRDALSRERGTVYKEPGGRVRVCLLYPNAYSLGMANLGFQAVCRLINDMDGALCERAFLPSPSDLGEFERTDTQLFSYESQTPVKEFDVVAFSIPFEDDYPNVPRMLALSGIPALSGERGDAWPLVIAGGVAISLNPEPLAGFIDAFVIGEGEGAFDGLMGTLAGRGAKGAPKEALLRALDEIPWTYIPSLYEFSFDGARVAGIEPLKGAKASVRANKNLSLDGFRLPESFIMTPDTEFKDTFLAEIERGCPRGCRFCAAGFLYLPPRWRDVSAVKESLKRGIERTGKAGLVGTAVSEYPGIKDVLSFGIASSGAMTLSSLRLDRLDERFLALLKEGGYKTITLAPEAGTERMRRVVNKGMTDEEILESVRLIKEAGFSRIKLYFLVGLPTEEDADADGIVELSMRIRSVMRGGELSLSVNPFIPKPFTPFQWHPFERIEAVERRLDRIRRGLKGAGGVKVAGMSARSAFVQAYIARSDRRAGAVIAEASKTGWARAIKPFSALASGSVYMERAKDDVLPWELIDHGVKKNYLWKEYQKGLRGGLTPPCDVGSCFRCGVC